MEILLDKTFEQLQQIILDLGEQKYRASQIFDNLYLGKSFSEISNISTQLKQKLTEKFIAQPCSILDKKISQDGTVKFLFKLYDNNVIESVLMKYKYGYTVCVSSQVGCRMGCKFCASTLGGLVRNLSAGEILGQVIQINKFLEGGLNQDRKVTNIVLMGSGEPLDNYDNVTSFINLVSTYGLKISQRNISLSTCGIVPYIYRLADDNFKLNLTISLHAPNDEIRKQTMPIANKYTIKQIVSACRYYFEKTKRRIIFEYVLIDGINNKPEHAQQLRHLLKGLSCHVNVISLNAVTERDLKGTTREQALRFVNDLVALGMSSTLRRTMGQDIDGACGQLRRRYLEDNKI